MTFRIWSSVRSPRQRSGRTRATTKVDIRPTWLDEWTSRGRKSRLTNANANPDTKDNNCSLHCTAQRGIVTRTLSKSYSALSPNVLNIDAKDRYGDRAVCCAVSHGASDIERFLIATDRVDAKPTSKDGATCMQPPTLAVSMSLSNSLH